MPIIGRIEFSDYLQITLGLKVDLVVELDSSMRRLAKVSNVANSKGLRGVKSEFGEVSNWHFEHSNFKNASDVGSQNRST